MTVEAPREAKESEAKEPEAKEPEELETKEPEEPEAKEPEEPEAKEPEEPEAKEPEAKEPEEPEAKEPKVEELEPEEPEAKEPKVEDVVDGGKYRALLIRSYQVPEELLEILPRGTAELETYLESPKFEALMNKMKPQPPVAEHPPEPKPKSSGDTTRSKLARVGQAFLDLN